MITGTIADGDDAFSSAPPGKPAYERLLLRSRLRAGLALDKSANYLGGVDCAAKLKRRYPRAKVVASVCNVASRLWSRMNHVNRDRKKDEADLSKTVDWPKHVVDVTRAARQRRVSGQRAVEGQEGRRPVDEAASARQRAVP